MCLENVLAQLQYFLLDIINFNAFFVQIYSKYQQNDDDVKNDEIGQYTMQ